MSLKSQLATSQCGWGFYTVRSGIDPGDLRFRPRVIGIEEVLRDFSSGNKTLSSPGAAGLQQWPEVKLWPRAGSISLSQSATSQWGSRFHTLRGGIYPGDPCFRPPVVGVVEIWKDLQSGDETLSSPGAAGPLRCPERQLSPRVGSMSLMSQLVTSQLVRGFNTLRGGIDPGDLRFRPRVVRVVDIWKGF